jgi:DNA-3-methyladenine glycosylase
MSQFQAYQRDARAITAARTVTTSTGCAVMGVNDPLPAAFYERNPVTVARQLLGKLLVRRTRQGLCVGRIVETEAYLAEDDAGSHAYGGRRTQRNAAMFGPPGTAYVYLCHGNPLICAVTEPENTASVVLIRGIEPLTGIEVMAERRGKVRGLEVGRGPGKLCQALAIDLQFDGWDLTKGSRLWIADHPDAEGMTVSESPRTNVQAAADLVLRFFIDGSPYVSKHRRWSPR